MAKDRVNAPFTNGYWAWDDNTNALVFISREHVKEQIPGAPTTGTGSQPSKKDRIGQILFRDTVDALGMAQFRRQFQRRIKPNEPHVVTLQDIKDVALFTAERSHLTPEFIKFLHTKRMDELLRMLIVYFQYYFQVWDNLILRREEAKRKLRQPIVTVLENNVRAKLAELRAMVARSYAYIILGFEDTFKYYHMSNRNNVSLSDKDRHLHECLLSIAVKIVWIALLRKNFTVIEVELNRMFRSQVFNIMNRLREAYLQFHTNTEENRVLLGKACKIESKLKHRSPAVQELIFDHHSYKMLAIGLLNVPPVSIRIAYLEACYTAPEELLFKLGVGVGILGLSTDYLNAMLMPKEGMAKKINIPRFKVPDRIIDSEEVVGETLPDTPPTYTESEQSRNVRLNQCKLWMRHSAGLPLTTPKKISTMETEKDLSARLLSSQSSITNASSLL